MRLANVQTAKVNFLLAYILLIALTVIFNVEAAATTNSDSDDQLELKLVSVVFRHGDRAPDPAEMFPTDPHFNDSFFPIGLGGLTNDGKLREYRLGKLLRDKYNDFLGDLYLPDSLVARSTDYKRTKMCLQLVLSALYPPRGKQLWHNELMWQPIPMNYVPPWRDWLMIPEECPEYLIERDEVERSPDVSSKLKSFQSFMQDLTSWTGKNTTTPTDMYNLYHILVAETYMNMMPPEWSKNIFPFGKLLDGTNLFYEIFSYNTYMRRINGGKLLYRIIESMEAIRAEKDKNRKIYLYSGHETNVAALLQTLGLYKPHVPEYTSAVIVELYKRRDKYFVKVIYNLGIPSKMIEQQIPGCDVLCPFEKFLELLSDVVPSEHELVCDKSRNYDEILDNTI